MCKRTGGVSLSPAIGGSSDHAEEVPARREQPDQACRDRDNPTGVQQVVEGEAREREPRQATEHEVPRTRTETQRADVQPQRAKVREAEAEPGARCRRP